MASGAELGQAPVRCEADDGGHVHHVRDQAREDKRSRQPRKEGRREIRRTSSARQMRIRCTQGAAM